MKPRIHFAKKGVSKKQAKSAYDKASEWLQDRYKEIDLKKPPREIHIADEPLDLAQD